MADMYSIVKKQDEKIDELLKTAKENKDLLMDIDTRLMSEPSQTTTSALTVPEKIQVELPANIATKENVLGAVNQALKNQTDYMMEGFTRLCTDIFPKQLAPQAGTPTLNDEHIERIAQAAADKAADKAVNRRYDKLDAMADTAMHRIYNLVKGALWAAIPKWAYITFGIAVLAAGGFGYGFFYQLNENSKLKDVEWLYRYERLWWEGKQQEDMLRREKTFAVGTQQEQDSIKNRTRQLEKSRHIEETFLYFNPTEK
ncbi:MAG: hypothetical protein K1V84_01590 [Muribaculaceae bacterium]